MLLHRIPMGSQGRELLEKIFTSPFRPRKENSSLLIYAGFCDSLYFQDPPTNVFLHTRVERKTISLSYFVHMVA